MALAGAASRSSGREAPAALQGEPPRDRGGQPVGARAEQRPGAAEQMVAGDRRERRAPAARGGALGAQLDIRLGELAAQLGEQVPRRGGLAPAIDLAQAAPLVEAAAQLLARRCRSASG